MKLKFLLIAVSLLLVACAPKQVVVKEYITVTVQPNYPEELLEKCSPRTKIPGTTGKVIYPWIAAELLQHGECIDRHGALVDMIRANQKD